MKISGAVLAAGMSSRMRRNKLLLPYGNRTIIEEVLLHISRCELAEIMVITGFENEKMEKLIKDKFGGRFRVILNEDFRLGRSESIKRAAQNISDDSDALLFMVGDKPTVKSSLISRAMDRFRERNPSILYILTPAGRGHPIIFSRKLFPELLELAGDTGSDKLIARHRKDVLELDDDEIQVDIDTDAEYGNLVE
jgi:molybdenum cofactor cytidylyltransferase